MGLPPSCPVFGHMHSLPLLLPYKSVPNHSLSYLRSPYTDPCTPPQIRTQVLYQGIWTAPSIATSSTMGLIATLFPMPNWLTTHASLMLFHGESTLWQEATIARCATFDGSRCITLIHADVCIFGCAESGTMGECPMCVLPRHRKEVPLHVASGSQQVSSKRLQASDTSSMV